jgi:hypothetical protein
MTGNRGGIVPAMACGVILLLAITGCTSTGRTESSHSWCGQDPGGGTSEEWISLAPEAAKLVRPTALRGALTRLRFSAYVRLSASEAEHYSGRRMPDGDLYLVRAGAVGAPGVSIERYLENAAGAIIVSGGWNRQTHELIIVTGMLAGYSNERNVAAVVSVPGEVSSLRTACIAAR